MELGSSLAIAKSLIQRYGAQAQAVAEERAAIVARQDPGVNFIWQHVPVLVSELRRTGAAQARDTRKKPMS